MKKKEHSVNIPTIEEVENEQKRLRHRAVYQRTLRGTIAVLLVVAAISVLVATLWMPVLQIYGSSMSPTLEAGQIVVSVKTNQLKTGEVVAFWQGNKLLIKRVIAGPGQWVDIDMDGNVTVDGQTLDEPYLTEKALGNCDIDLPHQVSEAHLLRNATPGGNIMEGSEIVGTLSISEGKIKVQFDQNYLEKKNNEGVTTIEGDFYITGEVNLSQLDKDGKKTLTTAGKTYKLDFGQDAIAKYGKVSVQKNCTSEKAISTTEGNFLSYTITVTAGEDGCPDVSVVDSLISNSDCVTYVGITSNATELAATSNEQKPYETIGSAKNSGKIYKGNAPTAEKPIPTEGETSITEPGSLVWKIGDMAPNERRTLTYYVKLKDDVALDNKEIKNQANVYSKTYKRVYDDATFTPKISYTMPKSRVGNIEKNTDGSYIINYELHFSLDKTNSNYPLENFVFKDYLKHSSNATDSKALPYISYDRTSVRVLVKTDGATDYNEIPKTEQLLHKQEHRTMCCMIRWIKG